MNKIIIGIVVLAVIVLSILTGLVLDDKMSTDGIIASVWVVFVITIILQFTKNDQCKLTKIAPTSN